MLISSSTSLTCHHRWNHLQIIVTNIKVAKNLTCQIWFSYDLNYMTHFTKEYDMLYIGTRVKRLNFNHWNILIQQFWAKLNMTIIIYNLSIHVEGLRAFILFFASISYNFHNFSIDLYFMPSVSSTLSIEWYLSITWNLNIINQTRSAASHYQRCLNWIS